VIGIAGAPDAMRAAAHAVFCPFRIEILNFAKEPAAAAQDVL
jgi:hypothetical protein